MYKILTLNIRGLNSSQKRRQVFRWLHRQQSDIIFLQETYSTPQTIKKWETEWSGKTAYSHGSTHSRGVMILFKPRLDVRTEKIKTDNHGRCPNWNHYKWYEDSVREHLCTLMIQNSKFLS